MKAYKCDICDKLYTNPTEYAEKTSPVTGTTVGFIPTGMKFTGEDSTKDTANYDVCPDCMAFFRKLIPSIRYYGGTDWINLTR